MHDTLGDVQMQAATLFDDADEPFRTIGEVCAALCGVA
jgi:hypothetical protein